MNIDSTQAEILITLLNNNGLLSCAEREQAQSVFKPDFVFEKQVSIANSVHFHIHVNNVSQLPHELLVAEGGKIVNKAEGYIKYAFDEGVNFIFSHIPVAQKEKTERSCCETYLDHIGIDIRSDDKQSYVVFQEIPLASAINGFYFKRQGDGTEVVKCCHMQVNEKYWVYPNDKLNYEFAFGPLVIHEGGFGVDLRPANPFNRVADAASECCSAPKAKSAIFIN